jgi:ketosteroid isomerase-like protein
MESELAEKTRRAYAAIARRDIEGIAELCHPDFEFTSLIRESEGGVYRGQEGLREFLDPLFEVLADWRPEIESMEEQGDRMLVKLRVYGTPPGGSVPMDQVMWQVIRFRSELAYRWDFFRTEEEARAALAADG